MSNSNDYVLVSFGELSEAERCLAAAKERFPKQASLLSVRTTPYGTHCVVADVGWRDALPETIQQFCAGFWTAVNH